MAKKKEDDVELVNLESEFNIKDEDLKFLIDTHEKANVKILKHHMKEIDNAILKIEDGLLEIIYTVDEIIEKYEEGKIFRDECGEAIEKLFVLADFTRKMEDEFTSLKDTREEL